MDSGSAGNELAAKLEHFATSAQKIGGRNPVLESSSHSGGACPSLVQRATVTLQPGLKQQINSLLMNEEPYSTILEEMDSTSSREVSRGRMK